MFAAISPLVVMVTTKVSIGRILMHFNVAHHR